jgi:hypothetical protein
MQGYFSRDRTTNQRYIIFRDRDFDAQPTANIALVESNSMFLTHRACVENYLLNAELIHNYWIAKYIEKLNNPSSRWGHGNSPGMEAISAWIEESAMSLRDYQAVRWALADLLLLSAARVQLKTTWTGGSGKLPDSLLFQDCRIQAMELINQFQQVVRTVTQERFEASLAIYQHQFAREEFWKQKQYLIWFHGRQVH